MEKHPVICIHNFKLSWPGYTFSPYLMEKRAKSNSNVDVIAVHLNGNHYNDQIIIQLMGYMSALSQKLPSGSRKTYQFPWTPEQYIQTDQPTPMDLEDLTVLGVTEEFVDDLNDSMTIIPLVVAAHDLGFNILAQTIRKKLTDALWTCDGPNTFRHMFTISPEEAFTEEELQIVEQDLSIWKLTIQDVKKFKDLVMKGGGESPQKRNDIQSMSISNLYNIKDCESPHRNRRNSFNTPKTPIGQPYSPSIIHDTGTHNRIFGKGENLSLWSPGPNTPASHHGNQAAHANSPLKASLPEENKKDMYLIELEQLLKPRKKGGMQPNDAAKQCHEPQCNVIFGSLQWKHHCRVCGFIYCDKHVSCMVALPEEYQGAPFESWPSLFTIYRKWCYGIEKEPVCKKCYNELMEHTKNFTIERAFHLMSWDLLLLKRAATIDRNWRVAAILCLASLRDIHYGIPTQPLSATEKRLLWNNRWYWTGHSRWTCQLMRAVEWSDEKKAEEAIAILRFTDRILDCWQSMCSRNCRSHWQLAECLELLSDSITNAKAREIGVEFLKPCLTKENGALDLEIISCILPTLVHDIRYEISDVEISPLTKFLLECAIGDEDCRHNLYWQLKVNACGTKYRDRYNNIKDVLFIELATRDKAIAMDLVHTNQFVEIIKSCCQVKQLEVIKKLMKEKLPKFLVAHPRISLPPEPSWKIIAVNLDEVRIADGASCPVQFPVTCILPDKTTREVTIAFKDDVRKDCMSLGIVRLMNLILQRKSIHAPFIHYRAIPTSDNCGFVQYVSNAITVEKIKPSNILEWMKQNAHNNNQDLKKMHKRFTETCAVGCLVSLLTGLQDRHDSNIMMLNDGSMFHIDYGWILGKYSSTFTFPTMTFKEYMKKVIGEDQDYFLSMLVDLYEHLRHELLLFSHLVYPLLSWDPPCDLKIDVNELHRQLQSRFLTRLSATEAAEAVVAFLSNSEEAMMPYLHDCIRKVKREPSNIPSNILGYFNIWKETSPTETTDVDDSKVTTEEIGDDGWNLV